MAIVQDTEQEQTQEAGLDQPKLGGEQSQELSQGVSATGQAVKSGPSTDRRGTSAGSRLSNLKKYVEANRNAGMAGKIQSGMEDIRKGVETGIGSAQTGLQQASEAEKSRLTKGEQLIQESQAGGGGVFEQGRSAAFTQDISPQTPAQPVVEQAPFQQQMTGTDGAMQATAQPAAEPVSRPDFSEYGQTAADRLAAFQRYKGGEAEQLNIQDEQKLSQDIGNLQKRANLAKSEEGRFQLLREQFGRPGYTTGQQRLDQLILQAAPEEAAALRNMSEGIADPVTQQLEQLRALRTAEQEAITGQATGLAGQIGQQLYGEAGQPVIDPQTGQVTDVGGRLGEFRTGLTGRVEAERARSAEQFGAIKDMVERGYDITPQLLADIGVTDPEQQTQFLDYYQRGQGRTLGTAAGQGGFDIDELRSIAEKTGTDYNQMKELYTGTPKSIQDFSVAAGKDYAAASPENKATLEREYENYKTNLAAQSADYRANLEGFVGENLADLRVKGPEIDYSQYLNQLDPERINASRVATAEDYARQAALQQLAGLNFGPLQQGQIGQAGTAGELGYGQFDIGSALGQARQQYETPEYTNLDRVSAQTIGESDSTIGSRTQKATERTTEDVRAGIADPLQEYTGTGGIVSSLALDPTKTSFDQTVKGVTETASGIEEGTGRVIEGDVLGGLAQIGTSGLSGTIQGAMTTPATFEKFATGGDRLTGVADDYTAALKGLTYGDFEDTKEAIKSTYKLPEQLTRDTVKKVDKVISEAGTAVSNGWSAVRSVFCFVAGSLVRMADGSELPIESVMPGQNIFGGGRVDIVGKALSDNIYLYENTEVSGSHPIYENCEWKRVENSENAKKLDKYTEPVLVYTMVTENHLMVVGNQIYTDFVEYDGSSLDSYEEVIVKLNDNTSFVEKVQEFLYEQLHCEKVRAS